MVTGPKGLALLSVLSLVQTLAILSLFLCFELVLQSVVETSVVEDVAGLFMLICQS